jgi:hypothetical protein
VTFEYVEIVRVRATDATTRDGIAGLDGAVLGISAEDDGEIVGLPSRSYERAGGSWMLQPADLEGTGRHDRRETFYDGSSIRVSQAGEIVDHPSEE